MLGLQGGALPLAAEQRGQPLPDLLQTDLLCVTLESRVAHTVWVFQSPPRSRSGQLPNGLLSSFTSWRQTVRAKRRRRRNFCTSRGSWLFTPSHLICSSLNTSMLCVTQSMWQRRPDLRISGRRSDVLQPYRRCGGRCRWGWGGGRNDPHQAQAKERERETEIGSSLIWTLSTIALMASWGSASPSRWSGSSINEASFSCNASNRAGSGPLLPVRQ